MVVIVCLGLAAYSFIFLKSFFFYFFCIFLFLQFSVCCFMVASSMDFCGLSGGRPEINMMMMIMIMAN